MQPEAKSSELKVKAVIYATDLSVCCQNVAFYAAFMARHFSAELLVTHAFVLSQAAMEVELDPALISEQRADLDFLLSRKAEKLAASGVRARAVLVEGDPKTVLVALAEKCAPSLLVLGTHGGGWIERELIGSVAEKVLRSTSQSVLTVGPQVKSAAAKDLSIKHILYATDFTPGAARAAVYAVRFAEAFASTLDVLHVVEKDSLNRPARLRELSNSFSAAIEEAVPGLAQGLSNPKAFVEVGNAHQQILQHIQDNAIDLLVLGIRKTSHLSLETRMSRAFQLIVHASCPVLTVVG